MISLLGLFLAALREAIPDNNKSEDNSMLFLFQATLQKPATMSNQDFYELWEKEAQAVDAGVAAGFVKWVYKVAGEPKVVAVMEVASHDQLDLALLELPIWKLGFAHLVTEVTWTPLRSYDDWHADLRRLAQG
jgi:muconolactone D-isomerase